MLVLVYIWFHLHRMLKLAFIVRIKVINDSDSEKCEYPLHVWLMINFNFILILKFLIQSLEYEDHAQLAVKVLNFGFFPLYFTWSFLGK